ncbi:hypothetical protein [Rhodoflexus sp.]
MRYYFLAISMIALLHSPPVWTQKVKEVKAFQIMAGSIERQLQLHEQYDPNGNLLYRYLPDLYCTMKYAYDAQNRMISSYQMCGESFWNGQLNYNYPSPYVTIVRSEELAGGRYMRYDSLNRQNKLVASWSYWAAADREGDSTITHIRHTYSPQGLLMRTHTRIITYGKRRPQQPDSQTDDFEEFEYNSRDSLTTKYTYSAGNEIQKRIVFQATYDSLSGRMVESFEQPYAQGGTTRREYFYDEQGRLSEFKNWYLSSDDAAWEMTREILYRYPNEEERIEIWRSYFQNSFDVEEVKSYRNDLLMRITLLDIRGQGQQMIVYEYSYH